jgi:hypothetical protein
MTAFGIYHGESSAGGLLTFAPAGRRHTRTINIARYSVTSLFQKK